jgi:hypothetical protein
MSYGKKSESIVGHYTRVWYDRFDLHLVARFSKIRRECIRLHDKHKAHLCSRFQAIAAVWRRADHALGDSREGKTFKEASPDATFMAGRLVS